MSQLSFEEFRKLPREEQNVRIYDLSDHDRFLARMNDYEPTKDLSLLTLDAWENLPEDFKEFFKEFMPSG